MVAKASAIDAALVERQRLWGALQPVVWLALGLALSFAYLYGPGLVAADISLPDPLFPSQAVILSVLLLTERRWWWLYLLVYYVLQVGQGLWYGLPPWYAAISNLANVLEPLVGAMLLYRFQALPPRFARLKDVGVYVACVVAGSIVGATWGAATRSALGFPFSVSWVGWFLADVLASLILTPTILLFVQAGARGLRPASRTRGIEAVGLGVALVVIGGLVFGTRIEGPDTAPALMYVSVPFLMWAAVRFGPRAAMAALSLVTILSIAAAASHLGPFVGESTAANVFTIQLFLFGVGVPLLCLAALVQERQFVQTGLRESEARYRAVVQNFPHSAVLLFGPDLRHLFADGQGLPELGLSAEDVQGKNPWDAFPSEIAGLLMPRYRAALDGGTSSVELAHEGRTYVVHVAPLVHAGSTMGMAIIQEVTQQRRAEVLAELDRTRTVFFNNVSHEFRTPLTLLLGPLEESVAAAESPAQRERLELAERNALRLLKLTNALLDFARIEAGRADAAFQSTDLPALTSDLAGAFRSAYEAAGLRLHVNCPPLPTGVEVYVDHDLWEKVVLNLLSNALKFTFEGDVWVSVYAIDGGAFVQLRVRDTGVGIPAEALPHLFERFYRVREQPSRTQEGTGIGLALVQELVKLHGGTIVASSRQGSGSDFVVTLPTGPEHLQAERILRGEGPATTSRNARPYLEEALHWWSDDHVTESVSGADRGREAIPRVLVADDNADVRGYLARLLGREYVVDTVGDGAAALAAVTANPPDMVVADIMMPRLDGISLVKAIRSTPGCQGVPVLLLSARAGEEARVEGLRAGADDYMVKPFAARELVARVGAHLALQKQRQRLLDAERSARSVAEHASSRAVALQAATSDLARASTIEEIGGVVIRHALRPLDATAGALFLRTERPDILANIAPIGYADSVNSHYVHVPIDAGFPSGEVVMTGEPAWIESAANEWDRFPYWKAWPTGSRAAAALPLTVDGETVGALVIGFAEERTFDADDRAFLLTLAGQTAAAVQRVRLHEAADQARGQAESALHARDEFLRTLAHDLKTPLTALMWHTQALQRSAASGVGLTENVDAVEAAARELMGDIDELRDLVRRGDGAPLVLHREQVDPMLLVREAVAARTDAGEHVLRVTGSDRKLVVEADRARLQRALGNLLDNAFKYSPRGSPIDIRVVVEPEWVLIHVQDEGVGIPAADVPFVFDRYRRGANVISTTLGEGIGLASARQILESHGGRLTVVSTEGAGSTFTVWLPVQE